MSSVLRWPGTWRLILFVTAIVGVFAHIGNIIPQIKTEPTGGVATIGESAEELVVAGEKIFLSDRAQCLTCHSLGEDPKARCPNQAGVGERAPNRKSGTSGAEYLVESLYNPNAYIVAGYPRNQMTPVNKPPIVLSHEEILAVIAYLNSMGGITDVRFVEQTRKAQEPWRKGLLKPQVAKEQAKLPILPGEPERGRQVFQKLGCNLCHLIGTEGGKIGPELTAIGASQGAPYILESVLDPNAVIVKGFKQLTVVWAEKDLEELQGLLLAWIPNHEHPQRVRLSVVGETGGREEREIDLAKVAAVGDAVVTVEVGSEEKYYVGEHVGGDEKQGVTLLLLENGLAYRAERGAGRRWVEQHFPPQQIVAVRFPSSPMPSNFAELMTPRETFDLVAYLVAQKGKK